MENNYSIEEILTAVEDLQKIKKVKNKNFNQTQARINEAEIPKNTLKLIEEAEKFKN